MDEQGTRLVLDSSVRLVAVADLPPSVRRALRADDGDVVLEGPGDREHARLLSSSAGALLRRFTSPATLDAAILDLSRELATDPLQTLDDALPVVEALAAAGVLVSAGHERTMSDSTRPRVNDQIGGFVLRRTLRNISDTLVFQAESCSGATSAVKVAPRGVAPAPAELLRREAAMLDRLDGCHVPLVLARGVDRGNEYLATTWFVGVPVSVRACELRSAGDLSGLVQLCRAVVRAFGEVHGKGVIHGDISSSNVLVNASDEVCLIDFGLAFVHGTMPGLRSTEYTSLEPEAARVALGGEPLPPPTYASEQYAIACLLFGLLTGSDPLPLVPIAEDMLSAVARGPVVRFTAVGARPWPQVEIILRRALAPEPSRRFPDLAALEVAFSSVEVPRARASRHDTGSARVDATIECLTSAGSHAEERESGSSVHSGAAGAAWYLYRAALIRNDPSLICEAERYLHPTGEAERSSPLHDASGVQVLAAVFRAARGDVHGSSEMVGQLVASTADRPGKLELFGGAAGELAAMGLLRQACGTCEPLEQRMEQSMTRLRQAVEGWDPVSGTGAVAHLGIAHGWAGILQALLLAGGRSADVVIREAVARLARAGFPVGRGLAWPGTIVEGHWPRTADFAPGWCAGSAGILQLLLDAHDRSSDDILAATAEAAAWHCFEHPDQTPQLCCGLAGRSIALSRLYRSTGDENWLDRAASLLSRALDLTSVGGPRGLFRRDLGVALAALELERPETAIMPLLGPQPTPPPDGVSPTCRA